jgi:poly(A) polymerase
MLTNILRRFGLLPRSKAHFEKSRGPLIIPRSQHNISRANISKHALKVLYRLKEAGYEAYLVGGGVRDVLLKRHPKDFDVSTNAHPEQVQKLFRNCRLIGRRFRLAHVHFGPHIVEVATFRGSPLEHSNEGMILRDNIYGTIEEDAWRRDFTINALYYNIADFTVLDFVGGLQDLKLKTLRMVGDASLRYREDPVRMLRAVRFSAKLGFSIHPETEAPLFESSYLVKQVPSARLFDEYIKLFLSGHAEISFDLLRRYGLFANLFVETASCLQNDHHGLVEALIKAALRDTDKRYAEDKPITLPFLLATFLWYSVQNQASELMAHGVSELQAFYEACDEVLNRQQRSSAFSKRVMQQIRDIWSLQSRLTNRLGRRTKEIYINPRFRAAYDFLLLRAKSGEQSAQHFADWWQEYVNADEATRLSLVEGMKKKRPKRRRHSNRSIFNNKPGETI